VKRLNGLSLPIEVEEVTEAVAGEAGGRDRLKQAS
jgi:hypothetical protein